jgi:phosphoribosylformylglycinamidine cyclo-ligase
MGHRMEIFTDEKSAAEIIKMSNDVGIDAKIIGYCTKSNKNEVELKTPFGILKKS